jgi:prepilin-type N-terminal cleavage/methylation domain-containing protein
MFVHRRRGYSLFEIMIVLAIMALAMAVVMPRAAAALDQVVAHTVFFDFQRQLLDLRTKAFNTNNQIVVLSSPTKDGQSAEVLNPELANIAQMERIALRTGWTYQLAAPLRISPGGICTRTDVDLFNAGHKIMHLESDNDGCRLVRAG